MVWNLYRASVKRYYEKLKQNLSQYKNLKFINCGVDIKEGISEINVMGQLSSINNDMVDIYKKTDWASTSKLIEIQRKK